MWSAALFGTMHLSLLFAGIDIASVVVVVLSMTAVLRQNPSAVVDDLGDWSWRWAYWRERAAWDVLGHCRTRDVNCSWARDERAQCGDGLASGQPNSLTERRVR